MGVAGPDPAEYQEIGARNVKPELRLAIVMNGGVSLAVWMGGTATEIDNLRRCSEDDQSAVLRVWRRVLAASGRTRVVVDLVAGSSAGGLNGALLATAIARGAGLPPLKTLWLEEADLRVGKLIRRRVGARTAPTKISLLDGDFFAETIKTTLESVAGSGDGQEITLLVTATALLGEPEQVDAEFGLDVRVHDGRQVYRFTKLRSVETDWSPVGIGAIDDFAASEALIAGARGSASFPVAFAPQVETDALRARRIQGTDTALLIDGGVLDNAPFEPMLDALRARPVDSAYERCLLYVRPTAPGPDLPAELVSDVPWLRVLGPMVSRLREPDERLDVEALKSAFATMGYTHSDPHVILGDALADETAREVLRTSADALFDRYRAARVQALGLQAMRSIHGEGLVVHETAMTDAPRLVPANGNYEGPLTWSWALSPAERILRWWGRIAASRSGAGVAEIAPSAWKKLGTAQRFVRDRQDRLEEQMRAFVELSPDVESNVWLDEAADRIAELDVASQFAKVLKEVAEALAPALGGTYDEILQASLDVEVLVCAIAWRSPSESLDVPRFRYVEMNPAAAPLYSLGPVAANPSWPQMKLYGERWGHFGAFASKGGRASDWLWGRLDAASTLCNLLLNGVNKEERNELEADLVKEILLEEEIDGTDALLLSAEELLDLGPAQLFERFAEGLDDETRGVLVESALNALHEYLPTSPRLLATLHRFFDPPNATHGEVDLETSWLERKIASEAREKLGEPLERLLGGQPDD